MNRRELLNLAMGIVVIALLAMTFRYMAATTGESWYANDFFADHHTPVPKRAIHYWLKCEGPISFGASAIITWTPSGHEAIQVICNDNNDVSGHLLPPDDAKDLHVSLYVEDTATGMSNTCTGDVDAGEAEGQFDHQPGWLKIVECSLSPTKAVVMISKPRAYFPLIFNNE